MSKDNEAFPVPIADAYWVVPGRLLAGEYPGSHTFMVGDDRGAGDVEITRARIRKFLDAGINYFLDLTDENDSLVPYAPVLLEEAKARGVAVVYQRIPIPDRSAPAVAYAQTVLGELEAALEGERNVYVHCWGGIGRTGVVVGSYLARHGIASGAQALDEIEHLRRHGSKTTWRSPETEQQRELVRNWRAGQ